MIKLEVTFKRQLLEKYIQICKEFKIKKNWETAHFIDSSDDIQQFVMEEYSKLGENLSKAEVIKITRRHVAEATANVIKGVATYDLSKDEIEFIKSIKRFNRLPIVAVKKYNYNNSVLNSVILELHEKYGDEKFASYNKRKELHDLIRERYKEICEEELDISEKHLTRFISSKCVFKVQNLCKSKIRKYIVERYNEGQRLFFTDVIVKEVQAYASNHTGKITEAIPIDEFPDIILTKTMDYEIVDERFKKILKTGNLDLMSTELVYALKCMIPHATFSQICYIISKNYFRVNNIKFNNKKEDIKKMALFRSRIYKKRYTAKYLNTMKQEYNADILAWL